MQWDQYLTRANVAAGVFASLATVFGLYQDRQRSELASLLEQVRKSYEQAQTTIATRTQERDRLALEVDATGGDLRRRLNEAVDALANTKAELVATQRQAAMIQEQRDELEGGLTACRAESGNCSRLLGQERPLILGEVTLERGRVHSLRVPDLSLRYEGVDDGSAKLRIDGSRRFDLPVEFGTAAFPLKFDEATRAFVGIQMDRFKDDARKNLSVRIVRFPAKCSFVDLGGGPPPAAFKE